MRQRMVAALLLISHGVLFSYCAVRKSICIDEGAHLAAGVAYLRWGEFSIYDLSPPLMRMWDALPAMLSGPNIPMAKPLRSILPGSRHWTYFEQFQEANLHALHRYVLMGRFMQLPISLGLAVGLFIVARRMYGCWAGLMAMSVYCLDPNVLAFASTVGTDLGLAAALFLAVSAWIKFLKTGNKSALLIAALAVGAAHAIKFNALLIWPVLVAGIFIWRRTREGLIGLIIVAVVCYVTVNLSYGFQLWGRPMSRFHFESQLMQGVQHHLPLNLRVPLPQYLVEGFDAQKWEADGVYISTLFGKAQFGGDWRYYPWMLLCKTPIAGLVLLACCVGSFFRKYPDRREIPFLLIVVAIGIGMVTAAKINIGLRYLLPAYPAMMVLYGRLAAKRWWWLIGMMAIEVGIAAPRFQSYKNIAAMRASVPDQDNGQSLIELSDWIKEKHLDEITLLSMGWVNPVI
ncbi:MAG TPA: hypothetical protein VHS31_12920, partial [Tepidisphaeraceae bacterium]|nr:hypothetical protein [Tepidisphaeraceae bacterium]